VTQEPAADRDRDEDQDPSTDPQDGSGSGSQAGSTTMGQSVSFAFNLGKIENQGEDSDPILREGRDLALVAVFDGMGGAGGTVYETPDGPRTGAYLASRVARDVVERRMMQLLDPEWHLDGPRTAADLHNVVTDALNERLADLQAPPSGLRSRLLRALPTTMALLALQRREPGGPDWYCHILWAGDSRAYVLEPDSGIRQLTLDDIRDEGDAMANLRQDSVVSNAMSADTAFEIHHRRIGLTAPFLVMAATDGCFGYVRSPMHFEELVLSTMRDAADTESWSAAVQARVAGVTGDDAAMAVLGLGADHNGFQQLFAERSRAVVETWIGPLDALADEVGHSERALEAARSAHAAGSADLWGSYKQVYEHHLTQQQASNEEQVTP